MRPINLKGQWRSRVKAAVALAVLGLLVLGTGVSQGSIHALSGNNETPGSISPRNFPVQDSWNETDLGRASKKYDALLQKAKERGRVRVIVGLDTTFRPEGALSAPQADRQRQGIARVQDRILDRIQNGEVRAVKRFKFIPYMVVEANEEALEALIAQDEVTSVQEDLPEPLVLPSKATPTQQGPEPPLLESSIALIGANNAFNDGFTGAGQTIAILDTGVDKSHPFLTGKVVSEACYSTNSAPSAITTLCPNGMEEQVGDGAGVSCPFPTVNNCDHGTHVAGIAAGNRTVSSGVARDADIIAIQVFSRFDDPDFCSPSLAPCVLSFVSEMISGLERVFELRNTFNIAAVNMSIGGGAFSSPCDDDSRKPAIDNLRSVGIIMVIASGNGGSTTGISSPACISTAVSVGATDSSDAVAYFSNCADILDVYAPGVSINSSITGGEFGVKSGTSMAAPHMAGAWALIRSKTAQASVDDILSAFVNAGVFIADSFCPTKPRIQVDSTLAQLPLDCLLPASGNWTVAESCAFSGSAIVPTSVIVEAGATLTIASGASLDINFSSNHLRIKNGARVIIQSGGKIE
jgi:subtilisin family serine protease